MKNRESIKLYQHLLERISCGFNMLGDDAKAEIKAFVISKQHQSGLFLDRANNPDVYYSFFGTMLSLATDNKKGLDQLKYYLLSDNSPTTSNVDASILILIKKNLEIPVRVTTVKILKQIFYADNTISLHYKLFISALILEANGKVNILMKFFLRLILRLNKTKDLPCSILAAIMVSKQYVKLKTHKEQKAVMLLYQNTVGFKAFGNTPQGDMLSTAVSLFALNFIAYDLRSIKPDCLGFIEDNYSNGAFLSADGDKTRDLEYTFYGLLALGSLNYKK